MGGHPFREMPCMLCSKPVNLTSDLSTDENGQAVHEECYANGSRVLPTILLRRSLPIDSDCPCGDRAHLCICLLAKGMHLFANFFSQGWRSLVPPSSSHSTSASSSLLGSTVPKSPVGFPKSAKP
jgi:hypothetical protein